ncbi:MAG TPA: alpha/beta hydrolase-fold protein [Acidimicrobiales bacterium]|nr:alpha/beta hydrolase-fold protein [Acidimicrobiales bacterium]
MITSAALCATALSVSAAVPVSTAFATASPANPFPSCGPAPAPGTTIDVAVGAVACQELTTHLLGDGVAAPFEYYVPPQCAPARSVRCPTVYLLHGFGGDYTEMLGKPGTTSSAWIAAETSQPPPGFEADPWNYQDPSTWTKAPALGMILVAPLGQTLPGGYGPHAGMDSYWVNWNPRYALGGDDQRYDTPPPQFESFFLDELVPFVEDNLPAGTGRDYRAIAGVSLGGYGAFELGLEHPDEWTTMEAVSGAFNFLFAPAPQPGYVTSPVGVQPPVPIAYEQLPSATGPATSAPLPSQVGTFTTALDAFGDPVADQAYFRGNMPTDLAMNAQATASGGQSLGIDFFSNDMVPMQTLTGDTGALGNDVSSEPFENIVFPMNLDMVTAFDEEGVSSTYALHQGNHQDSYRNAWFRGLEEYAYSRLLHAGGGGNPPPAPQVFDYRSISTAFSIWGWQFRVDRQPVEFLTLRSVSCRGLTLQGTGLVTVKVPGPCHTGLAGKALFTVDLGPSEATSDPAGLGADPAYGRTVTVTLAPLH